MGFQSNWVLLLLLNDQIYQNIEFGVLFWKKEKSLLNTFCSTFASLLKLKHLGAQLLAEILPGFHTAFQEFIHDLESSHSF